MTNRLAIQFLDEGFHRVLFDAVPIPVFVVDEDVTILEYNSAAGRLLGPTKRSLIRRRGGEALHCVHSAETPDGCGRAPACRGCEVRKAVRAALRGRRVIRKQVRMELVAKGRTVKVDLRVSCQPVTYGQSSFVLLILEGLNG